MESHSRSIAKAISYRVLGSASTALIFYVLSHNAKLAVGAGILDSVIKIGVYFMHEPTAPGYAATMLRLRDAMRP